MPRYYPIDISFENDDTKQQWTLIINESLSHHISYDQLESLKTESWQGLWKSHEHEAQKIGKKMFDLLNGSGGTLQTQIRDCFHKDAIALLNIQTPPSFDLLPFELVHDSRFLLLNRGCTVIRRISDRNRNKESLPTTGLLRVLFMACSPRNLPDTTALSFEREEELIYRQTEELPLQLDVEDSGSLDGLREALRQGRIYDQSAKENRSYDIIHLSGHATIDAEKGPVFLMEDEIGNTQKVTPSELWNVLEDYMPKMLFLSGCMTGQYDQIHNSESFAFEMVRRGIPFVLSWGLPVEDSGASICAGALYRALADGQTIDYALYKAREAVNTRMHVWSLLRLFSDSSPLSPLALSTGRKQVKSLKRVLYRTLEGAHFRVLDEGFVGRRREIQQGVETLRGNTDKYGALITGPAGIGKSCCAGKILKRINPENLIVLYGEVRAIDIVTKLRALFERKRTPEGAEALKILNDREKDFEERIRDLFARVCARIPVLFYFDDFEQNLIRDDTGVWRIREESLSIVGPFISDIDSCNGISNVVITSRYPFVLEKNGMDTVAHNFKTIPLMSFRNAELKKLQQSQAFSEVTRSVHADLYLESSHGNPRILEWLNVIAREEQKYDLAELKRKVAGQSEEYISKYLSDIIAATQGEEFDTFLSHAAVYRMPVPATAFGAFGEKSLLDTAVACTLVEMETAKGVEPVYWVMPVIRDARFNTLDALEQKQTHETAFAWYKEAITPIENKSENADYKMYEEIIHHALQSDKVRECFAPVLELSDYFENNLLCWERLRVLQQVVDRISDSIIEESIAEKEGDCGAVFNQLGRALDVLGNSDKAVKSYERALEIALRMYGENHPYVATYRNNLGMAWHALGEYNKAIEYYELALASDLKTYGENHTNVAIYRNNLGLAWDALGEYRKAIEYYELALASDLKTFGENHPSVAIDRNNLGAAWRALGEYRKAIDYYELALAADLKTYGENHPNVALIRNNLGLAWDALGEYRKAIEYYELALASDLKTYGENHPSVARDRNNLGEAWRALGEYCKAIEYYELALTSDLKTFGENHPSVARDRNNLGAAWDALGEYRKAIDYFELALASDLKTYGENHPNVARDRNNLGAAWKALGEYRKAIEYYELALASDLKTFGENHPSVARDRNNLGVAWRALGEYRKAIEYYELALAIFIRVLGKDHPSTVTVSKNLAAAKAEMAKKKKQ